MTVYELMPAFKKYALLDRKMKLKSYREIQNTTYRLCAFIGSAELKHISEKTVRSYLYKMYDKFVWSDATFKNNRAYLSTFFSWCKTLEFLEKNPAEQIEKKPSLHL